MTARVFIGRLSSRASERDVEKFFSGYGRIRDIVLKNGFGFVEFDDPRDADDAIYDLNGKDLAGERVTVEMSRRGPRSGGFRDGGDRGGRRPPFDSRRGGGSSNSRNSSYGPPTQTRHRIIVENLSTRISWQDLKDILRKAGCEPTYADAHRERPNEAIVCFATRDDVDRAMDKLDGEEYNGRKIKIIDDSEHKRSRSRSRSRSKRRDSRSRSRSSRRSSRSRSASPTKEEDKKSHSRSASPAPKSRSPTPRSEGDKSRSPSPADD